MRAATTVTTCILLILMTCCATPSLAVSYKMHCLGRGEALDVNVKGQVCGYFNPSLGNQHAFVWENGILHDLGTFGGITGAAMAINDNGHIVAAAYDWRNGNHSYIFDYSTDSILTEIPNGSLEINNNDQVIGDIVHDSFFWDQGNFTVFSVNDFTDAVSINNYGQVCGTTDHVNWSRPSGFVWQDGQIQDIGNLGGALSTSAYCINDLGQVVGASYTPDGFKHAFIWHDGVMQDIGQPNVPSYAYAINNLGHVVGSAQFTGIGRHAFFWENGIMYDLGKPDNIIASFATSISDTGWIAGYALDRNNRRYAVIWEPVPEPSGLLALISGITSILAATRKKRR